MPRLIKRVYPVSEIAHLWAAYNRGDTPLEYARSGAEYEGARFTGNVFYSEGKVSAVQRTAKSKARYVLAVPGRKHGVGGAVAEKNGRLIQIPSGAIRGRYSSGPFESSAIASPELDVADVIKALISTGYGVRDVSEARWLAKQERLSFPALLKEVLDADDTSAAESVVYQHRQAQAIIERKAAQAREAAERAANDKNPFVRALRGVSAAAHAMDRENRLMMHNAFGWMADLGWLAGHDVSRPYYGHYSTRGTPARPTLLKVRNLARRDEDPSWFVITSQGAQFPAEHGLAAWPFIERAWRTGEPWYPKATTGAALGHYRIDSVDREGTVHAGCHHVPFWSVAYAHFALQLGETPASAMHLACELVASRGEG